MGDVLYGEFQVLFLNLMTVPDARVRVAPVTLCILFLQAGREKKKIHLHNSLCTE